MSATAPRTSGLGGRPENTIDLIERGGRAAMPLADVFARKITYLRISVTDRCDLRCVYCMPAEGLPWIPNADVLSFEEIERVVRAGARLGLRSVRLTGGEPLLRPRLPDLVARLAAVPGIGDIALSTNGLRLAEQARDLRAAGLDRVNVSLDTLHPERFEAIARRPGLERVLAGIDAAVDAGLAPLKVNVVAMRGRNDDEIAAFAELTRERPIFVRFIELMPVVENAALQRDAYLPATEILARIAAIGALEPVPGPGGNGPARYVAFAGARGAIGTISPFSHEYCDTCNRVRLSADGRLRLCLFGNHDVDLRGPLRAGADEAELGDLLRGAMAIKPERHHLEVGQAGSAMRAFSEIGG